VKRREFLKATGLTGLFILFRTEVLAAPQLVPTRPAGYPMDFNAYLRIGADGRVGCFVGKVEMGQGNMTSLAMLAAEELDVPLERVDMLMGDTDLCPWDGGTGGSLSIWQFGPVLLGAAAEARAVLLLMAGERLQVPADRLEVKEGVVSVKGDPSRQVAYGQLVQGKRIERHLADVKPKPVSAYTLVGTSAPRKDALEKINGTARFSADQGLPGTLHACIVRPPAHGAKLKSADTSAAERMPGVRVLRDGNLVAVLHEFPDQARKALGLVKATFDGTPPALDDRTIYRRLADRAASAKVGVQEGDLKAAEARSATLVEADYLNAYVAHAAIEPHSAVAQWKDGRMTVWAGVQAPFPVKAQVAEALGLPAEKVRIITPHIGGAFGGKAAGPQAVEAARLAMKAGAPVQVVWDRREEFFLDTFRPAAVVKIRSGLDQAGRITFWDCLVSGTGDREAEIRLHRGFRGHRHQRRRPAPLPHRRLAGPGGQHQRVRPGVPHGHPGRQGQGGSPGLPPAPPHRQAGDPGAGGGGGEVRLGGRRRPIRARGGGRLRRLARHPHRGHGRSGCGPQNRPGAGEAGGPGPGHGPGRQPRRRPPADGGVHHHGPGLRPQRRPALQGRPDPGRELRHLPDPPVLLAADHRDRAHPQS
jgi:isoquinoline 1-oxidoreductase